MIVKFKENANPAKFNLGLENHGRSKLPGCTDKVQAKIGRDGRWVTGIDEKSVAIMSIPDLEKRSKEILRVKEIREDLEDRTGYDLSALSKFWDDYFVEINTNRPLDTSNPMDRISYEMLMANKFVAPSIKDCKYSDYFHVKYYVSKEHEDVSEIVERKKSYNRAVTALDKIAKSPDKAISIARYLGLNASNTTPQENLYYMLQNYIDVDNTNVELFLEATSKSPEDIGVKLTFQDALKFNVIRQRDGLFQRGNITLGSASKPEEVLAFLLNPQNSSELISIQEEVNRKRTIG